MAATASGLLRVGVQQAVRSIDGRVLPAVPGAVIRRVDAGYRTLVG